MKRIIILSALIICNIQIISCQKAKEEVSKSDVKKEKILKSIDFLAYPIDDLEGIATEGHEGVFRNFDFSYRDGEAFFILIPKIGAEKWYAINKNKYSGKGYEIDTKICKDLNKRGFKELSKDFNIWVLYTDIKYLKKKPKMDSPYSPKIPREINVYFYKDELKKWEIVDNFIIKNENDEGKENKWREGFIDKIVKKSNESVSKSNNENQIPVKWQGTYQREFSDKFSDGTSSFWVYYFIINDDKIIFKADPEIPGGDYEYKALEKNNQLGLFDTDTIKTDYTIKEEGGKYYIKGDSFENNNKWLLFEKKKQ